MPVFTLLPLLLAAVTQTPARVPSRVIPERAAMTACLAVTRADVEESLRRLVGNGKERIDARESSCDYAADGGQVTITIVHSAVKLNIAAEIAGVKATLPEARMRDVAGMGTRAFFMDLGGIGTQLHIVRGDYDCLLVSVLGFGDAGTVGSAAEKLARKALARL